MKKLTLLFFISLLLTTSVFAQEQTEKPQSNWSSYLHLESGLLFLNGTVKDNIAIRQNVSSIYVNQSSGGHISSETSGNTLGLKWEYFQNRARFGVATGVRYVGFNTTVTGTTSSISDFFYLRYTSQGSETKFARIKSITESNSYLSIPIEITYVALQQKKLGVFAKCGADFSIANLKQNTDINFQNSEMNAHKDLILSYFGKPSGKMFSSLYGSVGLKYIREDRLRFMFEVFLPSVVLTKNNFTLINADTYSGVKFSILYSLRKTN